ncbi:hypothetical protein HC928_03655 [bacterium]|nr:hypothetical protein [bacterium]
MQRFANVLLVLVLVLVAPPVHAQTYERFRLPEGTRLVVRGETYQGFDLGEYRELLHMDEDLRQFSERLIVLQNQVTELSQAATSLTQALRVSQSSIELLEEERTRLTELWEDENRRRHQAENRPEWDWIPWTLSAVLAAAVVVLSIVVGVGG